MTASTLFYIIIGIITVSFILDRVLDNLNASRYKTAVPKELKDLYNAEEYNKSQAYKQERFRFGLFSSSLFFVATLVFIFLDGFAYVDGVARQFSENNTIVALVFFGILMTAVGILNLPFEYYSTFVIEERFGFNKTTVKTYVLDKVKGALLGAILGGGILVLILWFYNWAGTNFWLYAWAVVAVFSLFMNLFYTKLIVPIFNKQTPLEEGALKSELKEYANKVGFSLSKIMIIDGSKRSTRANAYFSGFGSQKQVTLFDTLLNDLNTEEVVAVLAHEVGHYKRKHIVFNLVFSLALTGFTFWLFSLFVDNALLSQALGVATPSFHIGLITFGLLYSPISELTGLVLNYVSRVFEYQADNYAKMTYKAPPLQSALKKLAKNNMSNLTPHPAYVFMHYSHPPLIKRLRALAK